MIVVLKNWGREEWIANTDLYCGKILYFRAGSRASYHYHNVKDEHFYLRSGLIELRYAFRTDPHPDDLSQARSLLLHPGDVFYAAPGTRHQMIAYHDSELFEVSTHHNDSDVVRIVRGD